MDLRLTRKLLHSDGIFSTLTDLADNPLAVTLEHAYPDDDDGTGLFYVPKIPNGTYTCVLGPHILDGMNQHFQTYEITGVPGHTGLLFHWGNWDKDSEGCVLLGQAMADSASGEMVTNSRQAFQRFMELQAGVQQFQLTVVG